MSRIIEFKIKENFDGKKVEIFLRKHLGASARVVKDLKKKENGIMLGGVHARTIDLLHTGDILTVTLPDDEGEMFEPLEYPLEILYEDDDFLIVNKPAGLAVHPSHNHQGDTLANAVAYYLKSKGKSAVFRSVGRLDKGTSGIVICALNKFSAAAISGKVYKEYEAVCEGELTGEGVIDAPIYRPDPIITVRTVDEKGERAVTEWRALKTKSGRTHLRIHLQTGRTHQIRVHFAHIGMPLVGDTMYGKKTDEISHQALVCKYIKFTHPITKKEIQIEAPVPEDWKGIL